MDIIRLKNYVESCINRCGSAAEIARKCNISPSTLSQFRNGKYGAKEDTLALTISQALGYRENDWITVDTVTSYKQVAVTFRAAKEESMWMGISSRAGIGKTEALRDLYNRSTDDSVVYLECSVNWSLKQFFLALYTRTLGVPKGYKTVEILKNEIVDYLYSISAKKPLLIIDQADKLKPSAMSALIDLYNKTDSFLGAILAGTQRLETKIKHGANSNGEKDNFDEIDSRLGREFVHLLGATKADVKAICAANGVPDVSRQEYIWGQIDKISKEPSRGAASPVWFTEDFRRLMRLIKIERVQNLIKEGV